MIKSVTSNGGNGVRQGYSGKVAATFKKPITTPNGHGGKGTAAQIKVDVFGGGTVGIQRVSKASGSVSIAA
jgi:hypothetical protein